MKNFWYVLVIFIIAISCDSYKKQKDLSHYIPENASVILKINNLERFKSNLNNNNFLQTLSQVSDYKTIKNKLQYLNHISTKNPVFICFSSTEKDSLNYTIITKFQPSVFKVDSLPNHKKETISFKNETLTKSTINKQIIYSSITDSVFIGSSSKTVISELLNEDKKQPNITDFVNTVNNNKTFSVIINTKYKTGINTLFNTSDLMLSNLTNFVSVDVDIEQDQIYLNGITKAIDSSKSAINVFKNTIPQRNQLAEITPSNSDGFLSITFDDFEVFKSNLQAYNQTETSAPDTTLFNSIIEIGTIYEGNKQAVVLNSTDVIATKDALAKNQSVIETYRQIDIYNFDAPELFSNYFSPFITFKNATKYCVIDSFIIFAEEIDVLQNIIANYQNETTYITRDYYKTISPYLSSNASLLNVNNPFGFKAVLESNFKEELVASIANYKASALQFVYDGNFAHINAIVKKEKKKAVQHSVTETLNIKLDATLLNTPQLVINHRNKQREIVVQDVNNNLYLISNTGEVLWKKQLHGPILGDVKQVDRYKNGRLQLVFATPNRVYMLDRNGNDVDNFPLKFNDEITQPLSVFDYDKKKNYRFFVTQNKAVLVYNAKGKTVKGFGFSKASKTINTSPQHFRIGSKDYLVIKTDNKLYILNRRGQTRVRVKNSFNYSNQPVFAYKNKFTTTTADGTLVSIDQNGSATTQNLGLLQNHTLKTTSRTLVALSENRLTIKDKTLELDFGNYTQPSLFLINNKIYVSVTDLQTQKVYLYDSNAELLPNFPVYGISTIDLHNMDKDSSLEFITKGDDNTILAYKIN